MGESNKPLCCDLVASGLGEMAFRTFTSYLFTCFFLYKKCFIHVVYSKKACLV